MYQKTKKLPILSYETLHNGNWIKIQGAEEVDQIIEFGVLIAKELMNLLFMEFEEIYEISFREGLKKEMNQINPAGVFGIHRENGILIVSAHDLADTERGQKTIKKAVDRAFKNFYEAV